MTFKVKLVKDNRLESKIGTLIQTCIKGSKNSNSRAFYFKTHFIREYLHVQNLE